MYVVMNYQSWLVYIPYPSVCRAINDHKLNGVLLLIIEQKDVMILLPEMLL